MDLKRKTKAQLIAELESLREKVAGLENSDKERQRIEHELGENEQRFEMAIEGSLGGYWELWFSGDEDKAIYPEKVYFSPALKKMIGYDEDEFQDSVEAWSSLAYPDDYQRGKESTASIGIPDKAKDSHSMEFRMYNKTGSQRWIYSTTKIIRDENGRAIRMFGINWDITERKEAEQRLREAHDKLEEQIEERTAELKTTNKQLKQEIEDRKRAEKARRELESKFQHAQKLESLGILAGGIAHDFNNILVSIIGNANLALMDMSPVSPARESIEQIDKSAQLAADLTRQLLAFSGKGKFVIKPLDLSELVQEMIHLLKTTVTKRAILDLNLKSVIPAIEADPTQMRQVIINLIINASEALDRKAGRISITTGVRYCKSGFLRKAILENDLSEGKYVYLEVEDTGYGMDQDTITKIFDPFFSTKFIGRGLGLAAVSGIIRGHNAALIVKSHPQKGSTFLLLFPASDKTVQKTAEPREQLIWGKGKGTILVVDDDAAIIALAHKTLRRSGYSVLTASDGVEALELFRKNADRISAVLLDLTMPRMDGEATFGEIKKIKNDVHVIISSGYSEQEAAERFAGKELAGIIQKPYRPINLLNKLHQILH